jgi:hypothetical protein
MYRAPESINNLNIRSNIIPNNINNNRITNTNIKNNQMIPYKKHVPVPSPDRSWLNHPSRPTRDQQVYQSDYQRAMDANYNINQYNMEAKLINQSNYNTSIDTNLAHSNQKKYKFKSIYSKSPKTGLHPQFDCNYCSSDGDHN